MLDSLIIRSVATYDEEGIQITDIKKINFIYGANGSGKTTITKVIDNPSDSLFTSCSINWKNNLPIKTLVYNKDFRDKNFGRGSINGVFTLGQATKEEIEAIQKMQKELEGIKEKGIGKAKSIETVNKRKTENENAFKEAIWIDAYKEYENTFKEAFVGSQKKETFKTKILHEFNTNTSSIEHLDQLKEKAKTIFDEIPTELAALATITFERISEIELDTIWSKKIIGKNDVEIAKLIQKLNINDWVYEGRGFINDTTCPFCQQKTIGENFKEQLENYFDESFTNDTAYVKSLASEYNRLVQNVENTLQQIEINEKSNERTKLNKDSFSALLKTLSTQILSNQELLNNKIKEPSRSISLIAVKQQLEDIQKLISEANEQIQKHNDIVNNYVNEKNALINSIWKFIAEENKTAIEAYVKSNNGLQRGIAALERQRDDLRKDYASIDKKIKEANKNVTSVQPSVDEINKQLSSYGFLNFQIVPSKTDKNQYQIHREDGTIAESTLSEGEVTFITFLYYLQLAKGSTSEETITEERILVIDDPISSLDSNILFVVSSLIKQIIKSVKMDKGNIKQIILLTHNVYFHKEVSLVDGKNPENNDTNFWILRRNQKKSTIQYFDKKNPINNSYGLLWQELKNKNNTSGVAIQNTMRRIIENYFKILGKYGNDDLINKFTDHQEQEICRSLICWINDGSHSIPDDLFVEHHDTTIEKYFDVFKKVFTQMGHPEHYNMMMEEKSL